VHSELATLASPLTRRLALAPYSEISDTASSLRHWPIRFDPAIPLAMIEGQMRNSATTELQCHGKDGYGGEAVSQQAPWRALLLSATAFIGNSGDDGAPPSRLIG